MTVKQQPQEVVVPRDVACITPSGIPTMVSFEIDRTQLTKVIVEVKRQLALAIHSGLLNQVQIQALVLEAHIKFGRLGKHMDNRTSEYPYYWMVVPSAVQEDTVKGVRWITITAGKKTIRFQPQDIEDYPHVLPERLLQNYPTIERTATSVEVWLPAKAGQHRIPVVARIRNFYFVVDELYRHNPTVREAVLERVVTRFQPEVHLLTSLRSMQETGRSS
jgi:hypothetical protein